MIKKLLYKNPIKFCISFFIIGIIVGFTISVIAESINSDEVLYDNSNSSSNSDNVQDAIDGLYNIVDKVGSGYALVANNTTGLSTELVAGLYRYQGVQDANNNTVDNYICFGTTNKSDCVGDTDKYMYRIIGINTSGQMKLIKKEALNTAYKWNSTGGVEWAHSDLYIGINGSYFLTNIDYIPDSTWESRIATTSWHYGDITDNNISAIEMYNTEIGFSNIVSAKIGLMYLHDYYYGLNGGNNCSGSAAYSTCRTSWLHISNNDSAAPSSFEWIIIRYPNPSAYIISSTGYASWVNMPNNHSVRPVFFLNSNQRITSGNGTITDPYILS